MTETLARIQTEEIRCAGCGRKLADLANGLLSGAVAVTIKCAKCGAFITHSVRK